MSTRAPAGCFTLHQAAKALGRKPIALFRIMREHHILDGNNYPREPHLSLGRFRVTHGSWIHPRLGEQHYSRTYVTPRGLTWLRDVLARIERSGARISA